MTPSDEEKHSLREFAFLSRRSCTKRVHRRRRGERGRSWKKEKAEEEEEEEEDVKEEKEEKRVIEEERERG